MLSAHWAIRVTTTTSEGKHLPKSKVLKSTAGRKKAGKKTDKKSAGRLIVDKDGNMELVNKPEVSQKTKKED